mmetsp:Transcript_33143/g.53907  ORF Transcript_33143/g.53907 Transcript_33143/m.53907 type:complete len:207 (+) Transcript_33143:81-701(+)
MRHKLGKQRLRHNPLRSAQMHMHGIAQPLHRLFIHQNIASQLLQQIAIVSSRRCAAQPQSIILRSHRMRALNRRNMLLQLRHALHQHGQRTAQPIEIRTQLLHILRLQQHSLLAIILRARPRPTLQARITAAHHRRQVGIAFPLLRVRRNLKLIIVHRLKQRRAVRLKRTRDLRNLLLDARHKHVARRQALPHLRQLSFDRLLLRQ